jgi:DNA-binding transcriptional ArsR family regulator
MATLEDLTGEYLAATTASERDRVKEQISAQLYRETGLRGMIANMLFRVSRSDERLEDTVQEVIAAFVLSVLPSLDNPLAAWGAQSVAPSIRSSRKRIGSARGMYDFERVTHSSLNAPVGGQHSDGSPRSGDDPEIGAFEWIPADDGGADALADKMAATRAKAVILKALVDSKMKGKSPVSWLPQALSKPTATRRLPTLKEMPALKLERRRRSVASPDASPAYNRLVEIRDLTGVTVDEYAKHLNVQQYSLVSYLQRKQGVPDLVIRRAEQWFAKKGQDRAARVASITGVPLPQLLERWLEMTGVSSYAILAEIIDVSVPTITRWKKPADKDSKSPTRPMHVSHLLQCEDRVLRYCRANARKLDRQQRRKASSSA